MCESAFICDGKTLRASPAPKSIASINKYILFAPLSLQLDRNYPKLVY